MIKTRFQDELMTSESKDGTLKKFSTTSTSRSTAKASDIVLSESQREQTIFRPDLIDNTRDPRQTVSGKLVLTKITKDLGGFESEKITRRSIKSGEALEIALNTKQTHNLFLGLKSLYDLGENPVSLGTNVYVREDDRLRQLQELVQDENKFATLLESTTKGELDIISTTINIENLVRLKKQLDDNIENGDESFWQSFFMDNTTVLSLLFVVPIIFCSDKVYVGGKGMDNRGGKYPDFIYRNIKTRNAVLIEIKTPITPLMNSKEYRTEAYFISADLAGALSQVHIQGDTLIKEYRGLVGNAVDSGDEIPYKANHIESIIVIGNLSSVGEMQKRNFDLFRNDLRRVKVITYDEIQEKINILLELLRGGITQEKGATVNDIDYVKYPFKGASR